MGGLASMIDHTLLKPGVARDDLVRLCAEAREHGFAAVCVRRENVSLCARELEGAGVRIACVVGFPSGTETTAAKTAEARAALADGAAEFDMVLHLGKLKAKDYRSVEADIRAVVEAVDGRAVKVILETGALDQDEKIVGCALAKSAGAAFVKTSTGFGPGGATVEDVALMRRIVGQDFGVKASGGIRTAVDARRMIEAGANRLGTSAGVAIVTGKA
jgi:deoxyribose-phosphate aldolase